MKKTAIALAILLTLSAVLCGCGKKKTENVIPMEELPSVDYAAYATPYETVKLDLTKEDPSNDVMRFEYYDDGRIKRCIYQITGYEVTVSYNYLDGGAQLQALLDETVVAAKQFTQIGEYDPETGFSVHEGYYFKGFTF